MAIAVRRLTRTFPRTGYAKLKEQLTTAAESVLFTLVEGCGAETQREFARFLDMSIKSNRELESQLDIAAGYDLLTAERSRILLEHVVLLRKMLYTLRKRVLEADEATEPKNRKPKNSKPQTPG